MSRQPSLRARARAIRARRAGLSLVEVMLAMTIIAVAIVGAVGTITATASLSHTDEETMLASQGARVMLEQIAAEPFREVFLLYNETPKDDPDGEGTGPGASFEVLGLAPLADDADGLPGQVIFPVPDAAPETLREDTNDATFGLPRDLNLDGAIDAADHSLDYAILPVRVRIEWRGAHGARSVEFDTILTDR